MPRRSVTDRLGSGEVLLMDGGTGSELQRRGVEVLLGSRGDKLGPWSATANLDASDVVQQVHQDYLRVGADIIISNNFRTTRTRLAPVGLGERWKEYAEAGGRLAVRARDAINPEAYVAGGMAAPGLGMLNDRSETDVAIMGDQEYRREFAEHSKVLAATGVDVMLPEFVNYIDDCVAAVDACAEAGRPVWLGVPMVTIEGITRNGETMENLAHALRGHPVQAILLMCSRPEAVSATLPRLRQAFDGPIGAYPNVGYNPMAPVGGRVHLGPDLISAQSASPSQLARVRAGVDRGRRADRGRLLRDGTRAHHGHEGRRRRRPAARRPRASAEATAMRIVETLPSRVQEIENIWIPGRDHGPSDGGAALAAGGSRADAGPGDPDLSPVPEARLDPRRRRSDAPLLLRSRLRVPPRRHAGIRRLRRPDGRRVRAPGAPRRQGPDRLDRRPALVHGQGRHDRQLLGGLQRAPDRRPPAAGAGRDHHELLDRRSVCRRHALHGRRPPQRHARLGLVVLRPPAPAAGPGDLGPGLAAEVAGAARAVRAAAGRVAPAPAAGQLLEARLGQRGLRRDPVPRLRDRRLDGRLLERDPAAARAPLGAAPRPHRRLGPQVRPSGRAGAGDRLSPGVSPLVGPLAPGPGHRDHAGAHAAGFHAGGGAAARPLRGLSRALGGRAGLAPARAEDPALPPRRGRRAPGPGQARRHAHAPVGGDGRPRGRRVVSARHRRATARSTPPTSARTTPGASCSRRRHSAGRSRSWGSPPCRSRSPSTSRWRSWRSG